MGIIQSTLKSSGIGLGAMIFGFVSADSIAATRQKHHVRTEFLQGDPRRKGRVLFIAIPGVLADGKRLAELLSPILGRYGDTVALSNEGDGFSSHQVVDTILSRIDICASRYDNIVPIGSSVGGLYAIKALDIISRGRRSILPKCATILVDTPPSSRFLKRMPMLGAYTTPLWPRGPVASQQLTPMIEAQLLLPLRPDDVDPALDFAVVDKANLDELRQFKWSSYVRQVQAMIGQKPSVPDGVRVAFVSCTRDEHTLKREQTIAYWRQATSADRFKVVEVNMIHCGYSTQPQLTAAGFDEAIRFVLDG